MSFLRVFFQFVRGTLSITILRNHQAEINAWNGELTGFFTFINRFWCLSNMQILICHLSKIAFINLNWFKFIAPYWLINFNRFHWPLSDLWPLTLQTLLLLLSCQRQKLFFTKMINHQPLGLMLNVIMIWNLISLSEEGTATSFRCYYRSIIMKMYNVHSINLVHIKT